MIRDGEQERTSMMRSDHSSPKVSTAVIEIDSFNLAWRIFSFGLARRSYIDYSPVEFRLQGAFLSPYEPGVSS